MNLKLFTYHSLISFFLTLILTWNIDKTNELSAILFLGLLILFNQIGLLEPKTEVEE